MQAKRVAELRKPSVAAWAVNQLVRTQPRPLARLFEAGDALSKAQSELLSRRADSEILRAAVQSEREAVEELVELAGGLLSGDGHELTPATLQRVSETLQAAARDEDARARVREGCLVRELRHVGLGDGVLTGSPQVRTRERSAPATERPARSSPAHREAGEPTRRGRAEREDEDRVRRERGEREREHRKQAERAQTEQLTAATSAVADAERAAERAAAELDDARQRRDRAADALADAEAAVAAARGRVKAADRAVAVAEGALGRLS